MNPFRLTTRALVVSVAVLSLSACNRNSDSPPQQRVAPQQPESQTESQNPSEPSGDQKESAEAKPPVVVPAPAEEQTENRPATPAPEQETANAPAPVDHSNEPFMKRQVDNMKDAASRIAEKAGELAGNVVGYVGDKAHDITESVVDTTGSLSESTRTLVAPNPSDELRKGSIDEIHKQSLETRDRAAEDTKAAMAGSQPAHPDRVQAAIQPNDEMTELLAAVVSENDPERAQSYSSLLIDELFNEPEMARAKVMKLQLSLHRLAEAGLYNKDMANRVAYVQSQLDDRIRLDGSANLLRGGLIVAGTSLAFGAVAGFHGFDGARRFVTEFSPKRTMASAADRVGNAYRATRSKAVAIFTRGKALESEVEMGIRKGLEHIRLTSDEVIRRDIVALGVPAETAAELGLSKATRAQFGGYKDFNTTNMPGLRYSVVDSWDNVSLGDKRRVLFSVSRRDQLNPRAVNMVSREMSSAEADDVVKAIQFKAPENGGKDFVLIVDEGGRITPTRVTTEEVQAATTAEAKVAEDAAEAAKPEALAEAAKPEVVPEAAKPEVVSEAPTVAKRPRSKKSVAEAALDGDIPIAKPVPGPAAAKTDIVEATAEPAGPAAAGETTVEAATEKVVAGLGSKVREAYTKSRETISSGVSKVTTGTRDLSNKALGSVKPALKNFNLPWATTVAVGSAIPAYGLFMEGYREGRRYGEGHELLYLESLIPKVQLSELNAAPEGQNKQ